MTDSPIYFDNAASTFPKPYTVSNTVYQWLLKNTSNPGRSGHKLSLEAEMKVNECRSLISDYFGCDTENVIFTKNATEAINILLFGLLNPGDGIIISDMEHNSVLRPLTVLKNRGITVSIADSDNIINSVEKLITKKTKLIFIMHASNVTGKIFPIESLAKLAHSRNVLFGTDASQTAGYLPINIKEQCIDYLCASGHKGLYGIQGSGLLLLNSLSPKPLIYGGTGTDSLSEYQPDYLPEQLESGTLNFPAIISLYAGISYIRNNKNNSHDLVCYCLRKLRQIPGLVLYSDEESPNIVAFNIKSVPSDKVSEYLNSRNIFVRSGFHCSALAHKKLGTEEYGIVRVGFSSINDYEQIDAFIKTLKNYKNYKKTLDFTDKN